MSRPHHHRDQPFSALYLLLRVLSLRVHSQYSRTLGDLSWQDRAVTLQVQARRFRCLGDCREVIGAITIVRLPPRAIQF